MPDIMLALRTRIATVSLKAQRTCRLAVLGVVLASSRASPQSVRAPAAPVYTEADSAAVLSLAVDLILSLDGGRPPTPPIETRRPTRDDRPIVFVRIGPMPSAAWAAPSVARLRAWRWSYDGMAVDSTRIPTESSVPPSMPGSKTFPVELVLKLHFVGDNAYVNENWIWQTCQARPTSFRATLFSTHDFIRTPEGWRHVPSAESGGIADGLC